MNIAIFIYLPPFIDLAKYEEYILLGMYGEIHSVAELSYSFPWEFLYRTFIFLRCHRLNSLRPFVKLDGIGSLWKDVILNSCSRKCDQKVLIDEKSSSIICLNCALSFLGPREPVVLPSVGLSVRPVCKKNLDHIQAYMPYES